MSYPQILYAHEGAEKHVIFTAPDFRIIRKITRDGEQEKILRIKAAARALSPRISELVFLLSNYKAQILPSVGFSDLTIKIYMDSKEIETQRNTVEIVSLPAHHKRGFRGIAYFNLSEL
jgi:hypothetical protein